LYLFFQKFKPELKFVLLRKNYILLKTTITKMSVYKLAGRYSIIPS
jgi:hypothetical protein